MSPADLDIAGARKGALKSYLTGFILSLILTGIPFGVVMLGKWTLGMTMAVIFFAGIIQILVHLHYFLHVDASSSARWNVIALIFTVLILALFVGGSIWVMNSLNYRMM